MLLGELIMENCTKRLPAKPTPKAHNILKRWFKIKQFSKGCTLNMKTETSYFLEILIPKSVLNIKWKNAKNN